MSCEDVEPEEFEMASTVTFIQISAALGRIIALDREGKVWEYREIGSLSEKTDPLRMAWVQLSEERKERS